MSEVEVDDYAIERAIPDFGRCYCFTPDAMSDFVAEVVREAGARALEEAADALNLAPYTAINHGSPHRWPYQSWLRARAAEIREGAAPVTEEGDKDA